MPTIRLAELAKTIRSKNAGVDRITFDVIFSNEAVFHTVVEANALTRDTVARLFRIPPDRISDFVVFDPALAIKFTIRRNRPSGSAGDGDIFGCQQYAPLFDVAIPVPEGWSLPTQDKEQES